MRIDDMLRFLFAAVAETFTAYQLFANFLYAKHQSKAKTFANSLVLIAALFIVSALRLYPLNTIAAVVLLVYYAKKNFDCSSKQAWCWTGVFVMIGMIAEIAIGFLLSALYNISLIDLLNRSFEMTLVYVASKSLTLVLVKLMNNLFPDKKQELNKKAFILLTFPICAIMNEFLLLHLSLNYTIERSIMFWYAFVDICLIVAGFSIVVVYHDAIQKIELEQQLALKEQNEKANQNYLLTQERTMKELQAVLHDYKNQLRGIQGMCSDSPEAKAQYDALMEKLQQQSSHQLIDVNNIALSNILYWTQTRCEQLGIAFDLHINFADFKFLEPLDVSTIFDNAFDNAIRACSEFGIPEKRAIHLYTQNTAGFILLRFSNTCNVKMICQKDGKLLSTKATCETHGFGIQNIIKAAQAYSGGVSYEIENDLFTLFVRLNR